MLEAIDTKPDEDSKGVFKGYAQRYGDGPIYTYYEKGNFHHFYDPNTNTLLHSHSKNMPLGNEGFHDVTPDTSKVVSGVGDAVSSVMES